LIDTTISPTGPGTLALGERRAGAAARVAAVLAASLLFCWMAVWNGQPFLHPDSPSYAAGAETAVTTLFGERFATEWTAPQSGPGHRGGRGR
jgi:hypothetical protein